MIKLIDCYVQNFGILSSHREAFDSGLFSRVAENGTGKTTLTVFIKAMLYGLGDTRKTSLDENDRKKYLPWQGGAAGGYLRISDGVTLYRIERSFGKTPSEDTCAVYDEKSGKVIDIDGEIGEKLFKIDREGFEATLFISEKRQGTGIDNGSISSKLSEMVGFEPDVSEYENALSLLDQRRKFYCKKGGAGKIAELQERKAELDRKIDALEELKEHTDALDDTLDAMYEEKKLLEEAQRGLNSKMGKADASLQYTAIKSRLSELKSELKDTEAELEQIRQLFGYNPPTRSQLDGTVDKLRLCKTLINERNAEKISENEQKEKLRRFKIAGAVFGAALTLVGALLGFLVNPLFLALCAFLLLPLYFLFTSKNEKTPSPSFDKADALFEEAKSELLSWGITEDCSFEYLRERLSRFEYLTMIKERLKKECSALEGSLSTNAEQTEELSREELEKEASALCARLSELTRAIALTERQREDGLLRLEELESLKVLKSEAEEKLLFAKENFEAVKKTMQLLKEACENMTAKYLGRTKESFDKYISYLGPSGEYSINTAFSVAKTENGQTRQEASYSRGTRELYSFCMRLALADSLYDETEKPFLLLDDPFISFDDKRFEVAKGLLKKMSEKRQIIYLTCSEARKI